MEAFRYDSDDYQRLDYRLLQNGACVLYTRSEVLDDDCRWLAAHAYRVVTFDCSTWADKDTMLAQLAEQLAFPDGYGRNLDAFNDCLSDVTTDANPYWALRFGSFEQFARHSPDAAFALLDILEDASRLGLLFGHRLMALVEAADRGFRVPPFGAHSLVLNPREILPGRRS